MLMLDEATNSLDSAAEVAIQKALEEIMRGRTTIVIAHRLATTCKMDKIYVLQRIIKSGSPEELINDDREAYNKLPSLQLGLERRGARFIY